jgi:2-phosphoglycerate kinase
VTLAWAPGEPGWRVLLIGGGAGTGKTLVAHELATRARAALTQVDDIRLALQQVVSRGAVPALHRFLDVPPARMPLEDALDAFAAVARVLAPALEIVIAHHIATGIPIVLEGDGIEPAMARRHEFHGVPAAGRVRAVFLHEPDERALLGTLAARGRGFEHLPHDERMATVRAHHQHGRRITDEARALGLPVVASRPFATLAERLEATIAARGDRP